MPANEAPYGYRADNPADNKRIYGTLFNYRERQALQPVASLVLDTVAGVGPLDVVADITGSYDPASQALTYQIDWGDESAVANGALDDAGLDNIAHQYPQGIATATLQLGVQPADGDTVTIDDGQGNTVVFEFDDGGGVAGGNTAVLIGVDENETATNLANAINGSALQITASVSNPADVELEHDVAGIAGDSADVQVAGTTPPTVVSNFDGGQAVYATQLTVTDPDGNTGQATVNVTVD